MKYIKLFENINQDTPYRLWMNDNNYYMIYHDNKYKTYISRIFFYLDVHYKQFEEPGLYSKYDIDVIDFMKEIFLDKYIIFKSVNKPKDDPIVKGIVENIDFYQYKDEVPIEFQINGDLHLVKYAFPIIVKDYDAEQKPLHKEVELKKQAEKYNL